MLSNQLSKVAQAAMILPSLKSASLISMEQLCDDGCKVVLDQHDLTVVKNYSVILQGMRNKSDGLWDIPIEQQRYFNRQRIKIMSTQDLYKTV